MRELPLPTLPIFNLVAREGTRSFIRNNEPNTLPVMHELVLKWLGLALKKTFSKPRA